MSLLVSLLSINKILLFLTIMFIINFMLHWKFARIRNCSWVFVFAVLEGSGEKDSDGDNALSRWLNIFGLFMS